MKRRLFFWLEKLKIAPGERRVISGLLVVLVLLGGLNLGMSPSVPFEQDRYRKLEKQFAKRTAEIEAEEEKLMEQYNPPQESRMVAAEIDTVAEDSTSNEEGSGTEEKEEEADQKGQKERVNVNTADQKALESLPGIGPAYSKRIIKYRNENGEFESKGELKKIKGIGEKRLEKLEPFVKLKDSN